MLRFFSAPLDVSRPNITSQDLKKKILESDNLIVEHDFGAVLGSVYFVKPDDPTMLAELMSQLHHQPDVRKTFSSAAWISGGPALLSLPYDKGMPHHKLFVRGMSYIEEYIGYTIEALDQFNVASKKKMRLSTLAGEPVYNVFAKGLFGVDKLPDDLMNAFKGFASLLSGEGEGELQIDDTPVTIQLNDLARNVHTFLHATYGTLALDYLPWFKPFREARNRYILAARGFILSQLEVIKSDLLDYSNNHDIFNVLSLSIIEYLKQQDTSLRDDRELLNRYLQDMLNDTNPATLMNLLLNDYIVTVPSNIFAAENFKELIPCIIHNLASNPSLLSSLRKNLDEYDLDDSLSNMYKVIESDRKDHNLLHRIYLEGMRLRLIHPKLQNHQFGDMRRYYVTNPITIHNTTIPGASVVCILNGMRLSDPSLGPDPEQFNPDRFIGNPAASALPFVAFSYTPRRCPAYNVSEYVAKSFICYLATKFDFKLYSRPMQSKPSKIMIEFTEREFKEEKEINFDSALRPGMSK
jgi:hypothetical protein